MKKTKAMAIAGAACRTIRTNSQNLKLLPVILMLSTLTVCAQKSEVLTTFSKYNIDAGILIADNIKQPDDYAFDLKQTTITEDKEAIIVAKFDPSRLKEEQWTVVSVDGESPSKGDIKSFRKNKSNQQTSTKTDESSYKIEKESSDYLVISYKQDPATVAKDAAFMKDCRFYMTINLKTKRLEQVQALNEKPLKIKIITARKFDLTIKYSWNDQAKRYFATKENVNLLAEFLGTTTPVQTISEYSNYMMK